MLPQQTWGRRIAAGVGNGQASLSLPAPLRLRSLVLSVRVPPHFNNTRRVLKGKERDIPAAVNFRFHAVYRTRRLPRVHSSPGPLRFIRLWVLSSGNPPRSPFRPMQRLHRRLQPCRDRKSSRRTDSAQLKHVMPARPRRRGVTLISPADCVSRKGPRTHAHTRRRPGTGTIGAPNPSHPRQILLLLPPMPLRWISDQNSPYHHSGQVLGLATNLLHHKMWKSTMQ